MTPETFCAFREAIDKLRRDSGTALDDDSGLLLMARHVLGDVADGGRASYQVALSVCSECGRGHQQSCGELVPVGAEIIAMSACDAQDLGHLPHSEISDADAEVQLNDARSAHGEAVARSSAHVGAHIENVAHREQIVQRQTRANKPFRPPRAEPFS